MKKFINDPDDVVREALAGMAAAHPDLRVDLDEQIIVRADAPRPGKVGLVSGGGSGHEPLHGGFVGLGMLDAACPGEIFTSPVPDQILAATKAVDGGAGRRAHREELHRRRHELRARRRAGRRRRHRGRERPGRRRRRGRRLHLDRRAAAAPARPCWSRRSPARSPRRAPRSPRSPRVARDVNERSRVVRDRADRGHHPGGGQARLRPARGRDGGRRRHPRRARPRAARSCDRPRDLAARIVDADPGRQAARAGEAR